MCTVHRQEGGSIYKAEVKREFIKWKKKNSTGKKKKGESGRQKSIYSIDESSMKRRKWTEEKEDPPMSYTFK